MKFRNYSEQHVFLFWSRQTIFVGLNFLNLQKYDVFMFKSAINIVIENILFAIMYAVITRSSF